MMVASPTSPVAIDKTAATASSISRGLLTWPHRTWAADARWAGTELAPSRVRRSEASWLVSPALGVPRVDCTSAASTHPAFWISEVALAETVGLTTVCVSMVSTLVQAPVVRPGNDGTTRINVSEPRLCQLPDPGTRLAPTRCGVSVIDASESNVRFPHHGAVLGKGHHEHFEGHPTDQRH